MASITKTIQCSINSSVAPVTLAPLLNGDFLNISGNTGDLTIEKSSSEYALFGADFNSSECGVGTWSVSTNAYYSGFCSYLAKIKSAISTGGVNNAALPLTKVAGTTDLWAAPKVDTPWLHTVFGTMTLNGGASATNDDIEWVDYLNGRVKFVDGTAATKGVTSVSVDVNVMTLTDLGFANDWSLSQSCNAIDVTSISTAQTNGGFRSYREGLKSASLELSGFYTTGKHDDLLGKLLASNILIVELTPSGNETTESFVRGYFKIMSDNLSGDVGSDESESISLSLYVPQGANGIPVKPLSWVHPSATTLNQSVVNLLNYWDKGGDTTYPLQIKYLSDGTNGEGGVAVLTDISISGGLETIPEFSISFQGSGAIVSI